VDGAGQRRGTGGSGDRAVGAGPTAAQVGRVRGWLGAVGLTVTGVNQHYVAARETAAAAQRAFGVAERSYRLSGRTYHAPTGTATVPAAIGADVLGVSGLDDKPSLGRPADAPLGPPTANLRATPCSLSFGQDPATTEPQLYGQTGSWVDCGLTPRDIRTAYGLSPDPTAGAGVTIAITDAYASATILSDVATYTSAHGTPNFTPGQFTHNLPPAAMAETQPDGTHTSGPMRVAPDVAMDADNDTGMLVGQTVVLAGGTTERLPRPTPACRSASPTRRSTSSTPGTGPRRTGT
jgi:hypothetical protein